MDEKNLTVRVGGGVLNVRAGAIIERDGKLLMVGNPAHDYLYSVGGRIHFGESAQQAVEREVYEETGVKMRVKRLAAVHENFFTAKNGDVKGLTVYELSFFFYMDVPKDFEPVCNSTTTDGLNEKLFWADPNTPTLLYPEFFRTILTDPPKGVLHAITRDEKTTKTDCCE